MMLGTRNRTANERGFTLIECAIAMVIMVVGVLAVEALIVNGLSLQTLSANSSMANALAKAKVEELQARSSNDPSRANGGSLTSNVSGYYDTPNNNFIRRWVLSAGPNGTQDAHVQVSPSGSGATFTTVTIETLIR
jgi:prepilin-type N-terminal cleavage/methylation domain-containing protein